MCQPCYLTHGILSPDRLETRVAMIPVSQTNEAFKSNAVQDISDTVHVYGHHPT